MSSAPSDLVTASHQFIDLATPIVIGVLPIILHIIDKIIERFSPLSEDGIQTQMAEDIRSSISSIGKSTAVFRGVKTYFDYGRSAHFVVALSVFNVISLYFAQTKCTGSFLRSTSVTLLEMFAWGIFLVAFLVRVGNRAFDPAAVNPMRRWVMTSVVAFVIVLVTEVFLHAMCDSPPGF